MNGKLLCIGLLGAFLLSGAAYAEQQNSAPPPEQAPLQIPNPHYATINESVIINAPVDKVWARVGKFCDITEWMNSPEWEDCKYVCIMLACGVVRKNGIIPQHRIS